MGKYVKMGRRNKGLSFYQKKKKLSRGVVNELMHYVYITLAAVVVAFVLVFCLGLRCGVIGVSMQPTLLSGQQVLVNRFIYRVLSPKSGDVIAFLPGGNTNTHYYIKRVVAIPGDTVQIKDGLLYVNDLLYKDYSFDKIEEAGIADELLTLEQDEYFTIGDNVNNSEDSRADNIGPVKRENIAGKVWLKLSWGDHPLGLVE